MLRATQLWTLLALGALALACLAASLLAGSAHLSLSQALAAMGGGGDELSATIVRTIRLPRTISAFAVGSLLGLAGVLLQALFRNPLADPFVLGVSGGASVGALAGMLSGLALGARRGMRRGRPVLGRHDGVRRDTRCRSAVPTGVRRPLHDSAHRLDHLERDRMEPGQLDHVPRRQRRRMHRRVRFRRDQRRPRRAANVRPDRRAGWRPTG